MRTTFGDVSSSSEWTEVLEGRSSSGKLCVDVEYTKFDDGRSSFLVEVALDGMPMGWNDWELEAP